MSTATLPPPTRILAPVGPRLLTAADLAALPTSLPTGDVRYELNDGRLVVMAPPAAGHGRRQNKIGRYLDTDAEAKGLGQAFSEVGVQLRYDPDRVVGPDAAFVLAGSLPIRQTPEGYLETIPEIVVEVRSRNDTLTEIQAKAAEYFAAGVREVWVIDHILRCVTVNRRADPPVVFRLTDTLTSDLLPGFAVPVANLHLTDD